MKNLKVLFILLALQNTALFASSSTCLTIDSVLATENNFLPITEIDILGSEDMLTCIPEPRKGK